MLINVKRRRINLFGGDQSQKPKSLFCVWKVFYFFCQSLAILKTSILSTGSKNLQRCYLAIMSDLEIRNQEHVLCCSRLTMIKCPKKKTKKDKERKIRWCVCHMSSCNWMSLWEWWNWRQLPQWKRSQHVYCFCLSIFWVSCTNKYSVYFMNILILRPNNLCRLCLFFFFLTYGWKNTFYSVEVFDL